MNREKAVSFCYFIEIIIFGILIFSADFLT